MTLDALMSGAEYDPGEYNCSHLVVDAWRIFTWRDIAGVMETFMCDASWRKAPASLRRHFRLMERPKTPCIALLKRSRSAPHVGIYVNGSVLHITTRGVECMPAHMVAAAFDRVHYYDV
jgi:hypothetical protein